MRADFFTTGGTLRRDSPSYVERRADRELFAALRKGEYSYVLTSRQMGKSSLMVRTSGKLRDAGCRTAVLDLTSLGQNLTADQWYEGLLNLLGQQLGLEDALADYWLDETRFGPLRRFIEAIQKIVLPSLAPGQRLVIFIDEIDAVRSLQFNTDELFAGIRECHNRRRVDPAFEQLAFCLLGVATPGDLITDTRTTPFNIGTRIELTDFTPEEAAPLVAGLLRHGEHGARGGQGAEGEGGTAETRSDLREDAGAKAAQEEARAVLARILHWTGGHPYLTQRLCRAIQDGRGEKGEGRPGSGATHENGNRPSAVPLSPLPSSVPPLEQVDAACQELFLSAQARERDDNLLFVRERLLRSGADVPALLDLYGKVRAGKRVRPDDTNPLLDLLRLAGITRLEESARRSRLAFFPLPSSVSRLVTRNRIYETVFDGGWVRDHLPNAEVERQKAAYRRGVRRTALGAGLLVAVMTGLTGWAVTEKQHAERNATLARKAQVLADVQAARAKAGQERARISEASARAALGKAQRSAKAESQARREAQAAQRKAEQSAAAEAEARRKAESAQDRAQQSAAAERDAARRAKSAEGVARAQQVRADRSAEDARKRADESQHLLYIANMNLVQREWEADPPLVGHIVEILEATRSSPYRNFEWGFWNRLCHLDLLTLTGHTDIVWAVAVSPDGQRLLTGSSDGTAKLWNAASGRVIHTLKGHKAKVGAVAFSPAGRRILTGSQDGTAKVWDAATGGELHTLTGHRTGVAAVAFSPDGRYMLTGWDASVG
jgi:hypothetical protein